MTESTQVAPVLEGQKRRKGFQKGVSGNPAGRPKNSKNAITLAKIALEGELRKQLSYDMCEILQTAINLAKSGDQQMIKLLIDKVIPTTRASEDGEGPRERIQIVINKLPEADQPRLVSNVIEG